MKRSISISLIVVALLLPVCANATPVYKVVDLGTIPPGYTSNARSINDNGQIVGFGRGAPGHHAILFDPTGNGDNIDLGTFGGVFSLASSINNLGQIVGYADTSSGEQHATLFDPTGSGNNTDLGTLGGDESAARAINNIGQIVGYSAEREYHNGHSGWRLRNQRATLFDPTGQGNNINLGTLGGSSSEAYSINNNGQIVGASRITNGLFRAALFDPTGGGSNINLGTLGGPNSYAYCINNNGLIVGAAEDSLWYEQATLYNPMGSNINLGTIPGYRMSSAQSVNDSGQIVGWSSTHLGCIEYRAVLFDPTGSGNNIDLNTLIDPACGWTLKIAWSINNSGQIVGSGINPYGEKRAFLLIPEPTTVLLLGLGGLFLRKRRDRR